MKTYKKNYIGKGSQVENFEIIKITVKKSDIEKCTHEYEGEEYVSFEVAKMQTPDKFGRTHTCYYQTAEDTQEKPVKKSTKKPSKKQPADDLPY